VPGVNIPSDSYLQAQLNSMQQQLNELQTQQQYVMVNKAGMLALQMGLLQDGYFGMAVYDGSTTVPRVQVGQLPNGDYGLSVGDANGNSQEILPAVSSYVAAQLTQHSVGTSGLSGSPSVTCDIGASGNAQIIIGASVQLPTAGGSNTQAGIQFTIDGSGTYGFVQLGASLGASDIMVASVSQTYTLSGLGQTRTAGSHTFGLVYYSNTGGASFQYNFLEVRPL
jgi:hypothetical protein